MYRFSRAIYMETRDYVAGQDDAQIVTAQRGVLESCEYVMEQVARDTRYFPDPAEELFQRMRQYFPISAQRRVRHVIRHFMAAAVAFADAENEQDSTDATLLRCRAFTRDGAPCQRPPMPEDVFCPSHRRQAERTVTKTA